MPLTFDDVLNNRIGLGIVQNEYFLIICMIDFLDGAETFYLKLLNGVIYTEWKLTLNELILLSGIFNFGIFVGSLICGFFADRIGRRTILVWGCFIQVCLLIAVFLVAIVETLFQFIVLRFAIGVLYGVLLPISQILIAEIIPVEKRGRYLVGLQISFIVGYIWTIFLAYLFMENLMEGNWRAIALCNTFPCLICLIGTLIYLQESPRFLICQGKMLEGVEVINQLGRQNDLNYQNLEPSEIEDLTCWRDEVFKKKVDNISIADLFKGGNLPITWRSYTLMILLSMVFAGVFLILPFVMDDASKGIIDIFYTIVVEIPAVLFVYFFIDYWGRVPIGVLSSFINIFAVLAIWYWREVYLMVGLLVYKFFFRMTMLATVPLIIESYSTAYRSMGIGTTAALGRMVGFIAPAIVFPIYEQDHYLPFFYAGLCLISFTIVLSTFPKDLTGKPLDGLDDQKLD